MRQKEVEAKETLSTKMILFKYVIDHENVPSFFFISLQTAPSH